jgi:AcrR family transcriptional regulator
MARNLVAGEGEQEGPTRTTGKREPLTRDRIALTSLRLIDEIGLDDFSTRRLGAALGCEAMAIYNHFASKDALLDSVVDRLFSEVIIPPRGDPSISWEARVRGFAVSYRALAHAHPKSFPLLASRRFRTRARHLVEQIISALLEEGFAPRDAAALFRVTANYCNGAILDELSGTFPPAGADHPSIQRVQEFLGPEHYDALYERGLTLLMAGFSPAL